MSYYRFFRVEKPFQVFQLVGQSSTNAYYGSARLSRGVARPVMLKVGDVVGSGGGHDLRLVQGNRAVKISLSPPAEPLERTYGPGPSFAIEQKVKAGELVAVEEPAGLTFSSSGTRFPDNHPGVTEARKILAQKLVAGLLEGGMNPYNPQLGSARASQRSPEVQELAQLDKQLSSHDMFQDRVAAALEGSGVDNFTDLQKREPEQLQRLLRLGRQLTAQAG